ncbi:MAG: tetratricopeptide repeat protein [Burkholderiaceae bacterium]
MKTTMVAVVLIALTVGAQAGELASAKAASTPASGGMTINLGSTDDKRDVADKAVLDQAVTLIASHRAQDALDLLDPLVTTLEARYKDRPEKLYCSHGTAETLFYMVSASVDDKGAVALDYPFCDAYFMRGFAEIDLGRHAKAEADYAHALALAPNYPHYLSEMAELYSMHHDWAGALKYYTRAREDAPVYSPEGKANFELGRALRGIGYVDVELGNLDEAEAMYRRCLEIDPKDQKARGELGYVLNLKARQVGLGK